METKINELLAAINKALLKYDEVEKTFGKDDVYTKAVCMKVRGMQEAFEIVTGKSYIEYLMEIINAKIAD